jgi:hypothetical protein
VALFAYRNRFIIVLVMALSTAIGQTGMHSVVEFHRTAFFLDLIENDDAWHFSAFRHATTAVHYQHSNERQPYANRKPPFSL